jgi:hypothetical protein
LVYGKERLKDHINQILRNVLTELVNGWPETVRLRPGILWNKANGFAWNSY